MLYKGKFTMDGKIWDKISGTTIATPKTGTAFEGDGIFLSSGTSYMHTTSPVVGYTQLRMIEYVEVTPPPSLPGVGTVQFVVKDAAGVVLPNTWIESAAFMGAADMYGTATFYNVPEGTYAPKFSRSGYITESLTIGVVAGIVNRFTKTMTLAASADDVVTLGVGANGLSSVTVNGKQVYLR